MTYRQLIGVALLCALAGCSSQASNPYVNAGQTFRASGEAFGVPVSGSVRVGVSGGGLYIQPGVNMRQIRFGR
ncbi:TPA: hypothetical protein L3645_006328 [Pseudomonas aeruginosa]|nr:hypothetical protein [Pseudomonas aeruginosa]